MTEFARWAKDARGKKFSQETLATIVGCSGSSISKMEQGRSILAWRDLEKWADVLGIPREVATSRRLEGMKERDALRNKVDLSSLPPKDLLRKFTGGERSHAMMKAIVTQLLNGSLQLKLKPQPVIAVNSVEVPKQDKPDREKDARGRSSARSIRAGMIASSETRMP